MRKIVVPVIIVVALVAATLFVVFKVIGGSGAASTSAAVPSPIASTPLTSSPAVTPSTSPTPTADPTQTASGVDAINDAAVASATTWIGLYLNASSANQVDQYSWLEQARPVLTDDYYNYLEQGGPVDNDAIFQAAHQFGLSQKPDINCVPMIDDGASTDGDSLLLDCNFFSTTVDAAGNPFDITKITSVVWPYTGAGVTEATFTMKRQDDGSWRVADILW